MEVNANANAKARPFRGGTLLLLKEVDDLVAVAGAVALAGDVDPADATSRTILMPSIYFRMR